MKALNMKMPLAVFLIAWLFLAACSSGGNASSDVIAWQPHKEGLQAASAQGKKTFLYFRADW